MNIDQIGQKPAYSVYEERDAYRDLCGEMLESLRQTKEWLNGWGSAEPQLTLIISVITKAEETLGVGNETNKN